MTGVAKYCLKWSAFHHLPGVHDTQVVTDPGDHAQIMGDEDIGRLEFLLELFD